MNDKTRESYNLIRDGIISALAAKRPVKPSCVSLYERWAENDLTDRQFHEALGERLRQIAQEQSCFERTHLREICELMDESRP